MFHKEHYHYTAQFCEENIWQLLKQLSSQGFSDEKLWVLFITNPIRAIPLLNQQAAPVNKAIIWDYHVILLADIEHQNLIFDFDTRLPFVTPLKKYLRQTFIKPDTLPEELRVIIRKIPAKSYLEKFYSDRSHMLNQIEACKFPAWPVINAGQQQTITLDSYLNTEQDLNDGSQIFKISSIEELEQWLAPC